ncbi:MAG: putative hydrolase [Ferruginibacter sp.]|uniref:amidohydrolase n=1 Tax=Ferruginibacter sp. TaxID=1940288 RepID=UPI00265AB645|nr:amidohydrolase family protein [Ferruginibacter sp.]MDB5280636.1 putative hydrolase [Ferruginibacter sp.]
MRLKNICRRVFLLAFVTCIGLYGFAQSADIILTNGKIFTANQQQLYVQALAIRDNKILATGTTAAIEKLAAGNTKKIDLEGKTVVPGFNDQHDHFAFAFSAAPLTFDHVEFSVPGLGKAAVLDSVARLLVNAKPGEWIEGKIGTTVFFDTSMRRSLDSIAPDNPVLLQVQWGHGVVTNKNALYAAGLSDAAKDPVGGWYDRNSDGNISSVQQNAEEPFRIAINLAYPEAIIPLIESFAREQLRGGITSTLFMGTGFTHSLATTTLQHANIPQRLRIVAWPRSTPEGRQISEWPVAQTHPTPTSTISGIKYCIDGTPLEGNALSSKPYHSRGNGNGRLNYPAHTIRQMLKEALTSKRQLLMHITADSSFGIVLHLIKESGTPEQWRPLRVRVEHNTAGNPTKEQRKIIKDYGILIMHTPKFAFNSPIRSLLDEGILVGISPDGTTNPFWDITVITSQQANPDENLSMEQAVIAYTKTNAFAEFKEKEKGMLVKGMLADLTVLSQDIFTVPIQQLPATTSVLTMIDGKIVYQ